MEIRLLKKNDLETVPWQNGGGETAEVAISPPGALLATMSFDWRVSVATISKDGPFSNFPGYQRHVVVWQGEGLKIDGKSVARFEPFSFPGESSPLATLTAGSVKDLGLIIRRGFIESSFTMKTIEADEALSLESHGCSIILCAEGEVRVSSFYLNPGDLIDARGQGVITITALERSRVSIIQLKDPSAPQDARIT